MGNEPSASPLMVQKHSMSLEPTSSQSRSYNSINYKYSADATTYTPWSALSAATPEDASSSSLHNNNATPVGVVPMHINPIINGTNTNSLTANINQSVNIPYNNNILNYFKYDKEPINTLNNGLNGINRLPLTTNLNYNTNTLGVDRIHYTKLSLDHSQSSNSSTWYGDNNINADPVPIASMFQKIPPIEMSTDDSVSYSQRLGIDADQPLPQLMMNDEEIYTKNQGRKSILEKKKKKKKKKKRIFKFNKAKPSTPKAVGDNYNNDKTELNTAEPSLLKTKSVSISNVARSASRRGSVARSRARANAKRKGSLQSKDYNPRSRKIRSFSRESMQSNYLSSKKKTKKGKTNSNYNQKRRPSVANSKVNYYCCFLCAVSKIMIMSAYFRIIWCDGD